MTDEEETVLIGAPIDSLDEEAGIPGSIQLEASCGHTIWLAPSGQRFRAEHPDARLVCAACISAEINAGEDMHALESDMTVEDVMPLMDEQISELDNAIHQTGALHLTTDAVNELVRDSVFLDEEMVDLQENGAPANALIVEGIVNTYAFHPERLESHRDELIAMIGDLPTEFLPASQGGGGGWTFLNLCTTKDGEQWTGFHLVQERFLCMCAGLGMAAIMPRKLWSFLPGGVPYVTFDPTGTRS